jgi:hypothetical protein
MATESQNLSCYIILRAYKALSFSFITSGIYYLEHNYLEKFQIPSISEPNM